MTVSYQYDVASSASGGFIRLLFRWKGSVWKVVYREMLIFTVCYIILTILYNLVLTDSQQRIFERIVYFCATFMDLIPLSFMLGFYVSFIAARWWSQFIAIPWPDKLMNIIAMYIPGFDEDSRVVRRTLMRYLNLSLVLVLRSISMAVKRRFPTKEHLIEAGFMTKTELEMFQSVPSTEFNTFWIPCTWFINVLRAARQECRITDSNGLKLIMEELNEFRSKCGLLWGYDWISIPLVYTQVVTMATYAFYVACMFGRQNVTVMTDKAPSPEVHRYDYYIPIFTILQLMFYMGLLKVAEQLINPFGDDDEDFELNWIIDRHMKVSYLGVDTLNSEPPPLVKDTYYNELDVKIPYTEASKSYKKKTYRGSVAYMQVPMEGQGMVLPDMSEEEDDGETVSEMGPRRPSVYTLFQSRGKAGSFTNLNLDSRSIGSIDSEWKSSLPNLSTAKNASGTLGFSQATPFVVDMATAEDDEIVLQEVIIDRSEVQKPPVQRSDSLQIPGASPDVSKVKEPAFSRLRRLSPKIAPKFPREKLKSMFRKRRLSSAFPFYKLKGVRFTRDTKEDDKLLHRSLLDVTGHEAVDVEITLSTPELTEIEKETGVHPYYYTQQTISSAKQLATGQAVIMRQGSLARSESEENKFKGHRMEKCLVRSNSLPNISHSDEYARYVPDPIIDSSLKKLSEVMKTKEKMKDKTKAKATEKMKDKAAEKAKDKDAEKVKDKAAEKVKDKAAEKVKDKAAEKEKDKAAEKEKDKAAEKVKDKAAEKVKDKAKEKTKKSKMKRKSPPPKTIEQTSDSSDGAQETEPQSDIESASRRGTLPEITVTRYEQKAPKHLDLAAAAAASHSGPSCDRDPDSATTGSQGKRNSIQQKDKLQSPRTSQQNISETTSSTGKDDIAPEPHSTPKKRSKTPQHVFATVEPRVVTIDPKADRKRVPVRRKSPPPKRPEMLTFTKYTPTTKKIAGISLKSGQPPPSPTSDSAPSSPVSVIPSTSIIGHTPSVPKPATSTTAASVSPKLSSTTEVPTSSTQYPRVQPDTTITITDSKEDLRQIVTEQPCPPEPPQRHIPRSGGKGKK